MQGAGIGTLAVNINQAGHVSKEIFRVRGNQGNLWKKATVPLDSYLLATGALFNVSSLDLCVKTFSKIPGSGATFFWKMVDFPIREFSPRATTGVTVVSGDVVHQILLQI